MWIVVFVQYVWGMRALQFVFALFHIHTLLAILSVSIGMCFTPLFCCFNNILCVRYIGYVLLNLGENVC